MGQITESVETIYLQSAGTTSPSGWMPTGFGRLYMMKFDYELE
jgi:hypothetical protein